jgi:hypothetical protein
MWNHRSQKRSSTGFGNFKNDDGDHNSMDISISVVWQSRLDKNLFQYLFEAQGIPGDTVVVCSETHNPFAYRRRSDFFCSLSLLIFFSGGLQVVRDHEEEVNDTVKKWV